MPPMTTDDFKRINEAAYDSIQGLTEALWLRGGKGPTSEVLALNPACASRIKFFKIFSDGSWRDLEQEGAHGDDPISLVQWFIGGGISRERAARFIEDVLARAAPARPAHLNPLDIRSLGPNAATPGRVPRAPA